MANTNDLRYVKTERLLRDTYLQLKKNSRAPVKVSELCQRALINKTTFYTHYDTMEALQEQVCRETVDELLAGCPHVDEAFTNAAAFVEAMVSSLCANKESLVALFGNDQTKQINVFEAALIKRYLHGDESPEKEMRIIFGIGGASRLLIADQSPQRVRMTIELIKRVVDDPVEACPG